MVLKQRKQLNNLPRYDTGKIPAGSYTEYHFPDYKNQYLDFGMSNQLSQFQPTHFEGEYNLPGVATNTARPIGQAFQNGYNSNLEGFNSNMPGQQSKDTSVVLKNNFGDKVSAIGQGASAIIGNFLNTRNGVKSEDELLQQAGTSQNITNGVGWTRQNTAIGGGEMSKFNQKAGLNTIGSTASGAAAGAKVGGLPGAIIGGVAGLASGIFSWVGGANKLRKAIQNAQYTAIARNRGARAEATTTGLIDDYYSNYGNTQGGVLYV